MIHLPSLCSRYQCFCGNAFGKHGQLDEKNCQCPCEGDKNQNCGCGWSNRVFAVGSFEVSIANDIFSEDIGRQSRQASAISWSLLIVFLFASNRVQGMFQRHEGQRLVKLSYKA